MITFTIIYILKSVYINSDMTPLKFLTIKLLQCVCGGSNHFPHICEGVTLATWAKPKWFIDHWFVERRSIIKKLFKLWGLHAALNHHRLIYMHFQCLI